MPAKVKEFPAATQFINRELSWLAFNQRVLEEAQDVQVPLMERLKFLAISANNLDEFCMVRVGGLQSLKEQGRVPRDAVGLTPTQQLDQISRAMRQMVHDQYACYNEDLQIALYQARIRPYAVDRLDDEQAAYVDERFETLIYPIVTPMAIQPDQPFPLLPALTLHLAVALAPSAHEPRAGSRWAIVSMPKSVARLITIPFMDGHAYVLLDDVITAYMDRFFPGEVVEEVAAFRITRDADMRVREDEAKDLRAGMEDVLAERRSSECVRLEIAMGASNRVVDFLRTALAPPPR
jgi:polyphosphate kinase